MVIPSHSFSLLCDYHYYLIVEENNSIPANIFIDLSYVCMQSVCVQFPHKFENINDLHLPLAPWHCSFEH